MLRVILRRTNVTLTVLTAAGGVALSIAQPAATAIGAVLILLGVVVAIVDQVRAERTEASYGEAVERIRSGVAARISVEELLGLFAESCGVRGTWRITLYSFQSTEDGLEQGWSRVARLSNNPVWSVGGRQTLPPDQGVIGWAARLGGNDQIPSLPDPVVDRSAYDEFHLSRGVDAAAARRMRMPTRSYSCVVHQVGIEAGIPLVFGLVVESTLEEGTQLTSVQRTASRELFGALAMVAFSHRGWHDLPVAPART